MTLSQQTLETLIELVERKLSSFEVYDLQDKRELADLERGVTDLRKLLAEAK